MSYLLVDDDAICNFLTTRTLQSIGVSGEIHTALNGQDAMDLFNSYFQGAVPLPHTILLDLNMPIMDGFSFIEAFRKLSNAAVQNVRIIIVTSSCNPQDMQRARMLGVTQFLQKPLTAALLTEVLAA